jgi:nucleotide-binding universal stress UspA family protein
MKINNILVPTDFTDVGKVGTDFARKLAPLLGAKVHLLNRVHIHPFWHLLTEQEKEGYPESAFWEGITLREFEKLSSQFAQDKIEVHTAYGPGDIVPLVQNYIDEHQIDLLLMASHGSRGLNEWLFGSNAQKIIRHSACPALVVKEGNDNVKFQKIAFATDYNVISEKAFWDVIKWAKLFDAEVNVVHVNLFPDPGPHSLEFEKFNSWMADSEGVTIRLHEITDLTIEGGIKEFVEDIGADMMALTNYPDNTFKRLIMGSVSEALINHMDIPVMIFPAKEEVEESEE